MNHTVDGRNPASQVVSRISEPSTVLQWLKWSYESYMVDCKWSWTLSHDSWVWRAHFHADQAPLWKSKNKRLLHHFCNFLDLKMKSWDKKRYIRSVPCVHDLLTLTQLKLEISIRRELSGHLCTLARTFSAILGSQSSLFQKHEAPIASVPESQATVIDILAHFISFDSGSPSLAFQWFVPRATLWRHGFLFKGSVHGSMISEVRTVWLLCPTPIFVQHMEAYLPACLCQSAGHLPETLSPQVLGLWPWGKIKKIWPMQKWSFKCLISFFNQSYNAMHVVQQWNSSSCQEAL